MSGCSSCGTTTKDGKVAGCRSNGGCSTGGCNKMNVFDWLSNMGIPEVDKFDVVEVRFKGGRKEFFRNVNKLELITGDAIIVEVPSGHHLGHVSLQGELVRLQMQKKKVANDDQIKAIYRIASQKDIEKYEEVKKRENPTLFRTRQIADQLKLQMKLSDIEYQADNTKATFFYSAEDRVDFRELIKMLAGEFKIRVEMRQISLRQEAGRLGGIGSCGRELCCSTWLSDFKSVSTTAARYQNLSLNPSKLSGQCGRLKCCLNYELDTYMEALRGIPEIEAPLQTERGDVRLQKTDIFRKIMWFSFDSDNNWISISTDRAAEILAMNKKGVKPYSLTEDKLELETSTLPINNDLELMDKKFRNKGNNKKKKNRRPGGDGSRPQTQAGDRPQNPNSEPKQNPNPSPNVGPRQNANPNQGPRPQQNQGPRPNPNQGPRPQQNQGPRPQQSPRPEQRPRPESPQGENPSSNTNPNNQQGGGNNRNRDKRGGRNRNPRNNQP